MSKRFNISRALNDEQKELIRSLGYSDVNFSAIKEDDYDKMYDRIEEEVLARGITNDEETPYGTKLVDILTALAPFW